METTATRRLRTQPPRSHRFWPSQNANSFPLTVLANDFLIGFRKLAHVIVRRCPADDGAGAANDADAGGFFVVLHHGGVIGSRMMDDPFIGRCVQVTPTHEVRFVPSFPTATNRPAPVGGVIPKMRPRQPLAPVNADKAKDRGPKFPVSFDLRFGSNAGAGQLPRTRKNLLAPLRTDQPEVSQRSGRRERDR